MFVNGRILHTNLQRSKKTKEHSNMWNEKQVVCCPELLTRHAQIFNGLLKSLAKCVTNRKHPQGNGILVQEHLFLNVCTFLLPEELAVTTQISSKHHGWLWLQGLRSWDAFVRRDSSKQIPIAFLRFLLSHIHQVLNMEKDNDFL